MTAGESMWRGRVPIAALLVCFTLITAACSGGITNNIGNCNALGAGNGSTCGPGSKADSPGNGTRPGSPAAPQVSAPPSAPGPPAQAVVQMAGSSTFFDDQSVLAALSRLGVTVQDSSLGSLQECNVPGLIAKFDVSDSGSDDAATCAVHAASLAGKVAMKFSPYTTPMVIITYTTIVDLLEKIPGLVTHAGGLTIFNMKRYLDVFASGEEWINIPGNNSNPSLNRILLWTTDPQYSNSGGMLAAIAYAAQNANNDPVTTLSPGDPRVPVIRNLFTELGNLPTHTPDLLREFLTEGMAGVPMAMVYEADYLNLLLSHEISASSGITVMYPNPDVLTQNDTLVSWTPAGNKLIDVLTSPTMETLEESLGYRTLQDESGFQSYMLAKGITVPSLSTLMKSLQFARLPSESSLEALINAVTAN
jgi:hypothetical protein